jgi:hypothetical protein
VGTSSATIVKLDRSTGNVLWNKSVSFDPDAAIATTPTGDLVVGGQSSASADPSQARVWVYDTATGNERWHAAIGVGSNVRVATTSNGDIIATANTGAVLSTTAARLAGIDGQSLWSKTISEPALVDCGTNVLAIDGSDEPLLGGCVSQAATSDTRYELVKLKPDTGSVLWRRSITGLLNTPAPQGLSVQALAFDGLGNVASAGSAGDQAGGQAFVVAKWGLPNADDLLLPADRTCSQAIIKAGENYATTRLQAIEGCRDRINGGVMLDPTACPTDPQAMKTIHRAAAAARTAIAAACSPTFTAGLSCAATVDELISPDATTGCVIDAGDTMSDALASNAYGAPLTGGPADAIVCQPAIGTAGRRTVASVLSALNTCRTGGTPTVDQCVTDSAFIAAVKNAGSAARSRIKGKCTPTALVEVGPCATTLDGLVTPTFDGGCLLTTHRDESEVLAATLGN